VRLIAELFRQHDRCEEVVSALTAARALAGRGRPRAEDLESLGEGWVGDQALAIAVCCALTARDFADGIRLAANHSGNSVTTAAITGSREDGAHSKSSRECITVPSGLP
jgi:ADP-ribosyl-[dinitrogen reductase] hydrolase